MRFWKYHGLGNDYAVLHLSDWPDGLTPEMVRRICHRHFGLGSDGLLLTEARKGDATFHVRIMNPDGSEAEKSGNGLRILSRYLWEQGFVTENVSFRVKTIGGDVTCCVTDDGRAVTVQMGKASFDSTRIPVLGPPREVLKESMDVAGTQIEYSAVTVGNPHCVILRDNVSATETQTLGPIIENDARFPNRTNVQFVQVLDRRNIRIEIWERGAGYTLASGSSSCAAAAVARRLGLCDTDIAVHMPGGVLHIEISSEFDLTMAGPVMKVAEGTISLEIFVEVAENL